MPKKPEEENVEQQNPEEEDGFIAIPEAPDDEGSEEQPGGDEETQPKPEEQEEPEKKPAFQLLPEEEKPSEEQPKGEQPETIQLVHRGQVHTVTKEKAIELAQKGFDYDMKVGPHGKIAQMVDSNPDFAKGVQDLWNQYTSGQPSKSEPQPKEEPKFEIKPLEDFDNETEWLQANLKTLAETLTAHTNKPEPEQIPRSEEPPESPSEDALGNQVYGMFVSRDPEHAVKIVPKMMEYAKRLSKAQYDEVNSDISKLFQFYDFVKKQELAKVSQPNNPQPSNPAPENPKPSFRVRSGGGEMPRQEEDADYAWKMPKDEFEKTLAKAKGF